MNLVPNTPTRPHARAAQIVLIGLSALGTYGGGALSLGHMQTGETCPMLGALPACYIVFIGYALILCFAVFPHKVRSSVFYIGWTPIAGLATMGVILELIRGETCPPGPAGIPQCFLSLALAIMCWLCFKFIKTSKTL